MKVIVLSYGRAEKVTTLINMPASLRKRVELWVRPEEKKAYSAEWKGHVRRIVTWPDHVDSLGKKMAYLSLEMREPFVRIDDDLTFKVWHKGEFVAAEDNALFSKRWRRFEDLFSKYDGAGLAMRFMAHVHCEKKEFVRETSPFVVYGVNPRISRGVDFKRAMAWVDRNQHLQLLEDGRQFATYYGIVHQQSQAKALLTSGCNTYRSNIVKVQSGLHMVNRFPGVVLGFRTATSTENGGGLPHTIRERRIGKVTADQRAVSEQFLAETLDKLGLQGLPALIRWRWKEPREETVARIEQAWRDMGWKGKDPMALLRG